MERMQPDAHRCGTSSLCVGSAGSYHLQANLIIHCVYASCYGCGGLRSKKKPRPVPTCTGSRPGLCR